MCRSSLGIAVAVISALAFTGCEGDGSWATVSKFIGWDNPKVHPIPKYPQPNTEIAQRVENMGHQIIAQNTFAGIEPLFTTIGVPESVLFHRGPEQLFVSEGLVLLCKSDAELAAVLCSELGQMVAEKKNARKALPDRDSFPDSSLPGNSPVMTGGGTPEDLGRQAEIRFQQQRPKPAPSIDPVDASKQAATLLSGAGFDPATLDQIQPLLRQSDRGAILRKQMSGSAPPPTWTGQ